MGGSKKPGACASVLDGLSVRAPRTITIFDWRLFCLHKLLVVLILGYVVLQADYLAETVHTGVFAVRAEGYETGAESAREAEYPELSSMDAQAVAHLARPHLGACG